MVADSDESETERGGEGCRDACSTRSQTVLEGAQRARGSSSLCHPASRPPHSLLQLGTTIWMSCVNARRWRWPDEGGRWRDWVASSTIADAGR